MENTFAILYVLSHKILSSGVNIAKWPIMAYTSDKQGHILTKHVFSRNYKDF